jgi:hypothetical protein
VLSETSLSLTNNRISSISKDSSGSYRDRMIIDASSETSSSIGFNNSIEIFPFDPPDNSGSKTG